MTREDREEWWTEWKEAKALFRLRREEYYAEIRARQICRWRAWMEQNEEFIDTLRIESDHCDELGRNARNEDFADRVRERIESKSQKISDLKRRNEELESKIAEPRAGRRAIR
jgi:hypothetical protein